jgi:ABC-type dipeptide/oligopeptide/nickel transport system permease component
MTQQTMKLENNQQNNVSDVCYLNFLPSVFHALFGKSLLSTMTVAAQMIFESHPTTIIVKRPLKMIDIR